MSMNYEQGVFARGGNNVKMVRKNW